MSGNAVSIDIVLATPFLLERDEKQRERQRPCPPLAPALTAARLREAGFELALWDGAFAPDLGGLEALLTRLRPRCLCVHEDYEHFLAKMCLAHVRDTVLEMIALARRLDCPVVVLSVDAVLRPEPYLAAGASACPVDGGMPSLVRILRATEGAPPGMADAPSVEAIETLALEDEDPLQLPRPAWELVDLDRYRRVWAEGGHVFSLPLVASRGCGRSCVWCSKAMWGNRRRLRPVVEVLDEMEHDERALGLGRLWFVDDLFGLEAPWLEALAEGVQARGLSVELTVQMRADGVTASLAKALARCGCRKVWLGVESGSPRVLRAMGKELELEAVASARQHLAATGVATGFFLMLGFPGEDWDDLLATRDFLRAQAPDDVGVSACYPLPGSPLARSFGGARDGELHRWRHSGDLRGPLGHGGGADLFRALHDLLHDEQLLASRGNGTGEGRGEAPLDLARARLDGRWAELGKRYRLLEGGAGRGQVLG